MGGETEKITINLNPVDLGKIELLVDQGFFSNRTDLIRTAIRNEIAKHEDIVNQAVTGTVGGVSTKGVKLSMGVWVYTRRDLEQLRDLGEKIKIDVVGMLALTKGVTPELARQTIESIRVFGSFRASKEVKEALADRIAT